MNPDPRQVTRASFRMALWLLLFYLITLVEGYITFPFIGHATHAQNLIYGIIVGAPFWISILVFLALTRRELSSKADPSQGGKNVRS